MLKAIEIGLTVLSISLGAIELLGRTNVVPIRTPTEAIQDVFDDGPATAAGINGPGSAIDSPTISDLTVAVEGCDLTLDGVLFDLVVNSDEPFVGQATVLASSSNLSSTGSVIFADATLTSTFLDISLPAGTHEVTIQVDPNNEIVETDDTNNQLLLSVEVPTEAPLDPTIDPCL